MKIAECFSAFKSILCCCKQITQLGKEPDSLVSVAINDSEINCCSCVNYKSPSSEESQSQPAKSANSGVVTEEPKCKQPLWRETSV